MDNEKELLTEQEEDNQEEVKVKTPWQLQKESWYDKVPLSLKQLDTLVRVCWIVIAILIIVITLDAMDIFNPFGS